MTNDQLKKLLVAIEEDENITAKNIMKMALISGMRKGEMFKLKWENISFDRGFILTRDPKSGIDQKIPLNSSVRDLLNSIEKSPNSPFAFPGKDGRQLQNIYRSVRRIKEKVDR